MDHEPRTSVIMAVHNSERTVMQAVNSVLAQSDGDLELLVTDDGSADGSVALVESCLQRDTRLRLFRHSTNQGAAAARNTSILEARGRYIAFLDSDDLWLPEKLARQLPHMATHGAALGFTAYSKIPHDFAGSSKEWSSNSRIVKVPERGSYSSLSRHDYIGCLTAIYDRSIVGTVMMPDLRMRQDYGLWLKILRSCDAAVGLNVPLALYRTGSTSSLSGNKLKTIKYTWNVHRELEKRSRLMAAWNVGSHLAHATLKHVI